MHEQHRLFALLPQEVQVLVKDCVPHACQISLHQDRLIVTLEGLGWETSFLAQLDAHGFKPTTLNDWHAHHGDLAYQDWSWTEPNTCYWQRKHYTRFTE